MRRTTTGARAASTPGTRQPGAGAAALAANVGVFLVTLNISMVTVALPDIGDQLNARFDAVQWVLSGYSLVFAALLLSAGALSDRIGASRAVTAGLAIFTLGAVACATAPNLVVLVVARLSQGVGAAVMMPATLSLLRESVPEGAARTRAIAGWSACASAALVAGPPIGGGLTTAMGWPAPFWVNLPLGVLGLLALCRVAPSARRPARFDLPGQVTAVVALVALTYTVIRVGETGPDPVAGIAAALCGLSAIAFVLVTRRAAHPMLPLGMLTHPTVAVAYGTGFAINFTFNSIVLALTVFLRERGDSAMAISLVFVPMMVLVVVSTVLAAPVSARFGTVWPIRAGLSLVLCGLAGTATMAPDVPNWVVVAWLVPVGVGGGLVVPPMTETLLAAVRPERAGVAGGLLNAARQVGSSLAAASIGAVLAGAHGTSAGMRIGLGLTAAVVAAMLVTTSVWRGSSA
nr:MFS transporter [Kibdelosporangium sp. MJ126-NF4]CEL17924.1 Major facilitator superfamily [Kibdelosporangium sp. MJ126-NF4]CTQ90851.1 Major facilitator superfamily [Kibdelosporangium sp. MJ126-NF4]